MATLRPINTAESVLERRKRVMRLSDIIEHSPADELTIRRDADRLVIDDRADRFVVGRKVFIRLTS